MVVRTSAQEAGIIYMASAECFNTLAGRALADPIPSFGHWINRVLGLPENVGLPLNCSQLAQHALAHALHSRAKHTAEVSP